VRVRDEGVEGAGVRGDVVGHFQVRASHVAPHLTPQAYAVERVVLFHHRTEDPDMQTVTLSVSDETLYALRMDAAQLGAELRLAAAALFYERGMLSQERAADLAGLPRAQFLVGLGRLGISPFQETADDIVRALGGAG
jgi:predicted HTH domain antitoxin